jgi:hypothetical protein
VSLRRREVANHVEKMHGEGKTHAEANRGEEEPDSVKEEARMHTFSIYDPNNYLYRCIYAPMLASDVLTQVLKN